MPVRITPRSKYHAKPLTVDGIRFASTREARRYGELRLLVLAGQIWDLTLQPSFELHVRYGGPPIYLTMQTGPREPVLPAEGTVGVYRADFAYATKDGTIVEDVKGVRTALYNWKKKHVEIEYGVRIVEV